MCGIIGFLDKTGNRPLGQTLLTMLEALSCRGPDSAGVAVFGPASPFFIQQIMLPEADDQADAAKKILEDVRRFCRVINHQSVGNYLRLEVEGTIDPVDFEIVLVRRHPGLEVVSLGHSLEIVKQVGSPAGLEKAYGISKR